MPLANPDGRVSMPHYLIVRDWRLSVTTVALSLLVSLWAFYLDPVVNIDGIIYIEAAELFTEGRWADGFAVYKWPFYSLLISAIGRISGTTEGHAAYFINTFMYAATLLGFVAFIKSLGGRGRILWLAAFVALLHPVLNEFRSFVIRDVGYWACYLWSLAYFLTYLRSGRTPALGAGVVLAFAAFLFRIEGILLLTVVPVCIYAFRSTSSGRTAAVVLAALLVMTVVVAVAPLWQYVSERDVSTTVLFHEPLDHVADGWRMIGTGIESRLDGLRREFAGVNSNAAALLVYVATVVLMSLTELMKTLGVVYTGLVGYVLLKKIRYFQDGMSMWWWVIVGIQGSLVLQFSISNFFLAERYPVALALTLLAPAPFLLDEIWARCAAHGRNYARGALVIAVLIAVESADGLNVATQKQYLKEAGLWLRANASPSSTLYSNNRILSYYAGLEERKGNAVYSWHEAMQEVWTDRWRRYDYFALVMTKSNSQNEVLLLRRIDSQPVRTFSNRNGDKVLIFRSG